MVGVRREGSSNGLAELGKETSVPGGNGPLCVRAYGICSLLAPMLLC